MAVLYLKLLCHVLALSCHALLFLHLDEEVAGHNTAEHHQNPSQQGMVAGTQPLHAVVLALCHFFVQLMRQFCLVPQADFFHLNTMRKKSFMLNRFPSQTHIVHMLSAVGKMLDVNVNRVVTPVYNSEWKLSLPDLYSLT